MQSQNQGPPKRDGSCNYCTIKGHWARECFKRKRDRDNGIWKETNPTPPRSGRGGRGGNRGGRQGGQGRSNYNASSIDQPQSDQAPTSQPSSSSSDQGQHNDSTNQHHNNQPQHNNNAYLENAASALSIDPQHYKDILGL